MKVKNNKRVVPLGIALSLILICAKSVRAETQFSGMVKLFSSIYLEDNAAGRYFPHGAGEFGLRRLEVRFGLAGDVNDKVSYSVRLDGFASPDALSLGENAGLFPESSGLGVPLRTESFELALYEASVKVNGFLLKNLDLTVGKQRLSWGTADKMNVVDNLNPVDLANFFTFDPDYFAERRPQTGINLEYYFSESSRLQFVWLLERQYSPLPRGFSSLLGQTGAGGGSGEVHLDPRAPLFKNTNYGLRFATMLGKLDLGLTWYHGNFHLPILREAAFSASGWAEFTFTYPGQQVMGADLAGEALGLGFWAEAAAIFPEKTMGSLSLPMFVNGQLLDYRTTFSVFSRATTRFVLGVDTTLSWGSGLYLNVQYLRGFFDEIDYTTLYKQYFQMGKGMFFGEPEDFLLGRAEYKFLRGELKLEFSGLVEMAGGNSALVFMPGLEYRASDVFSLRAGAFWVAGDEQGTKFGQFKKDKLVYFAFKVKF